MSEEENNKQTVSNESDTANAVPDSEVDEQTGFDEQISNQSAKPHDDNKKPNDQIGVIDSIKMLKHEHELSGELKALKRDLNDLESQLKKNTDTYNDNRNILENFESIVEKQRNIINANQAEMDDLAPKIETATAAAAAATAAVAAAKADLNAELEPYQSQKDSHQDRINELQDKLDSIERDMRNASDDDAQTSALEGRKSDLEESINFENGQIESIDDEMDEISRRHDAIIDPLLAADAAAAATLSNLQSRYNDADKAAKNAEKRIKYCEHVKTHPEETVQLGDKIEEEKKKESNLEEEKKKEDSELTDVKAATKKGKIAIGITAAALVIIAVFVVILVYAFQDYGLKTVKINDSLIIKIPEASETESLGTELATNYDKKSMLYTENTQVGRFFFLQVSIFTNFTNTRMSFSSSEDLFDYYRELITESATDGGFYLGEFKTFQKDDLLGESASYTNYNIYDAVCDGEILVIWDGNALYSFTFAWPQRDEAESKPLVQKCIDSIEPVNPSASSIARSND